VNKAFSVHKKWGAIGKLGNEESVYKLL
jgi:hypothetical protein